MSDHELAVVSCIAKALKQALPPMPIGMATRYAKKILNALQLAGYVD